jgi:hypothetical protein
MTDAKKKNLDHFMYNDVKYIRKENGKLVYYEREDKCKKPTNAKKSNAKKPNAKK